MINFVNLKNRECTKVSKAFFKKKRESNDSGTESDGDILDAEKHHLVLDMETSRSFCTDSDSSKCTNSSAMMCQSHLLYDQHSSEEELEVINGPTSVAAAEAAAKVLVARGATSSILSERGTSSLDPEELSGEVAIIKRSSSTLLENRKRSLVQSSDDETRTFLEPVLTPVNFRTTPPLEALKPNRSHMFRSTTPLILSEARCGIENMKICDNNVSDGNGEKCNEGEGSENCSLSGGIKACTNSLRMSSSSHHIYHPQPKYSFHYNTSRSSPASTTKLDLDVRSISPPAKLFHSAISPKRRPIRTQQNSQRLQRPHRPCLDFDKMQQVSL